MTEDYDEIEKQLGYELSEETRAALRLHDLWSEGRFGIVQGVEIDLRHPDLGEHWSPTRVFGNSSATGPWSEEGPWLIFPWTAPWDRSKRRGAGRATLVDVGDRVRIDRVERVRVGTELDHPHDRERRDAFLVVERSSGGRARPKRPVVFWPELSLMRPRSAGRPTFSRVAARICDALGIENLDSYRLADLDSITLTEAAFEEALAVQLSHKHLLAHLDNPHDDRWRDRDSYLSDIINSAVAVGYHAARAENERFMAPAAHAKRKIASAARRGGQRGAETRRRKGDLWRVRVRPIILEIMAEPGAHTRDNVANEVEARWTWPQRCPSVSSLKGLLAEMEALGEVFFPGM